MPFCAPTHDSSATDDRELSIDALATQMSGKRLPQDEPKGTLTFLPTYLRRARSKAEVREIKQLRLQLCLLALVQCWSGLVSSLKGERG